MADQIQLSQQELEQLQDIANQHIEDHGLWDHRISESGIKAVLEAYEQIKKNKPA